MCINYTTQVVAHWWYVSRFV